MSSPDRVVLSTTTSSERVALTEDELLAKGQRLAALVADLVDLRELHKEQRKAMKMAEDDLQGVVLEVREDVALRAELRDVPCEWVAAFPVNEAHLVRIDTGEVLRARELEDEERQLQIVTIPPPRRKPRGDGEV